MRRIPTGILTLDHAIEGGPPEGSLVVVRGGPGSGKTLLVLQSLYAGALEGGTSIYFPFDETPENIQWYAERFGWDIGRLQREKKFYIYYLAHSEYDRFKPELISSFKERLLYIVKSTNAKRIAFDSMTTISYFLNDAMRIRTALKTISEIAKSTGTLIYVTVHPDDPRMPIFEMVSDGIIDLVVYEDVGGVVQRGIRITKMRATHHPLDRLPLWIEDDGITVGEI